MKSLIKQYYLLFIHLFILRESYSFLYIPKMSASPASTSVKIWIAVGSGNPCKIEAVRSTFQSLFATSGDVSTIVVTSHNVPSGVSDQPYGDNETKSGAINRANAAWEDAVRSASGSQSVAPDFAVGLEGGVEEASAWGSVPKTGNEESNESEHGNSLWCMAWMAVRGSSSVNCTMAKALDSTYIPTSDNYNSEFQPCREVWGYGRTGAFLLPPEITRLMQGGMEMGEADDRVFKRINSKQGTGTVGKLTMGRNVGFMMDRSEYYVHALKLALIPWIRPELYITD